MNFLFSNHILDEPSKIILDPVTCRTVKMTTKTIDHFYVFETKCKYIPQMFQLIFALIFCSSRAHLTQVSFCFFASYTFHFGEAFRNLESLIFVYSPPIMYILYSFHFDVHQSQTESHAVFIFIILYHNSQSC